MASEREILLLGVLNQLDLSGKIDYKLLARDIGTPSPGAAQVRWSRFRTKLRASTSANVSISPIKSGRVNKSNRIPAKKVKWARKETIEKATRADDELDNTEEPETPFRTLPVRKVRGVVFKDELSDFDDLGEEKRCDEVMKLMEGVEEGSSSSDHSSWI